MATLLTGVLRLFMMLMGLAFLLGLVAALVLYTIWATLRWLITGRKPQVVMVWQQFSAMRSHFSQGGFRTQGGPGFERPWGSRNAAADRDEQVVDVEVREVHEAPPLLPSQRRD